jgi:hypothetical protein
MKPANREALEALSRGPLVRGEDGHYQEGNPRLYARETIGELREGGLAKFDRKVGAIRITGAGRQALGGIRSVKT